MGGLMSITGGKDGEPGAGPQKVGVALTDILTGLYSTVGILAALSHRHATGEGQYLDMALLDVQVACLANQASNYLVGGKPPVRMGNAHPNIVPYQDFPTRDGYMVIATGNDAQFTRLCEVLGAPDLATDRSFATNAARAANRAALTETLNALLMARTRADWLARLEAANVPAGPINGLSAAFDDPQARARGLRIDVPHASLGTTPGVASPLRLSATPPTYDRGPPVLGQDTGAVLGDLLGLDPGEIEALFVNGVVAGAR
jgi:crotonobetainyl-CoA:carnitine CoA-transferase CaiB-like acyl-CoA transferase